MNQQVSRGTRGRKPTMPVEEAFQQGVVRYTLTPEEIALISAGRGSLVPDGEKRGLVAPPIQPRKKKEFKPRKPAADRRPKSVMSTITLEMLMVHIQAGLTNAKIAEIYGVSRASISLLLKKFGMGGQKGKSRNHFSKLKKVGGG